MNTSAHLVEILEARIAPAVVLIPESFGAIPGAAGHHVELRTAGVFLDSVGEAEQLFTGALAAQFIGSDHGVNVINYHDADTAPNGGNFGADRDLSFFGVIPAGDNNDYAIRASGYLQISVPGTYTFGVNSDDGFRLRMGANEAVVTESLGPKGPSDVTGEVIVETAGLYRYELLYFEAGGGSEVEFFVSGPGIATPQLVGNAAGVSVVQDVSFPITGYTQNVQVLELDRGHSVLVGRPNGGALLNVAQAQQLLNGQSPGTLLGSFDGIPVINFRDASNTPEGPNFAADADFHSLTAALPVGELNDFALKAKGYLYFPTPGQWKLGVNSDDGARLTVGTSNTVVINADGLKGNSDLIRTVNVPVAGYYPYELIYFEHAVGAQVEFFAQGPGDAQSKLVGDTVGGGLAVYDAIIFSGTEGADVVSFSTGFGSVGFVTINGSSLLLSPDGNVRFNGLGGDDAVTVSGLWSALDINLGNGDDKLILGSGASLGTGSVIGDSGVDELDYSGWTSPIVANLGDRHAYLAKLDGAQVVPSRATTAAGHVLLFVSATDLGGFHVTELFSDLIGLLPAQIVGTHLHAAAPGVNGPIQVNLGTGWMSGGGESALFDTDALFPSATMPALAAGNLYFDVHTTTFVGGEIRGNFTVGAAPGSATGVALVSGVENVTGSSVGDFIVARNATSLFGGAGDDTLVASLSDDLIDGGPGDDRIYPGLDTRGDIVRGGPGSDTLIERRIAGAATLTNTTFKLDAIPPDDFGENPLESVERVILIGNAGDNALKATAFTRGPVALAGGGGTDVLQAPPVFQPAVRIADALKLRPGASQTDEMEFVVSLSQPIFSDLTLHYSTLNGTARAGDDFAAADQLSLVIPAGQSTAVIKVSITAGDTPAASEAFSVKLHPPSGAILTDGLARGVIYRTGLSFPDAKTAVFREGDGDLVTIKTTKGEFAAGDFVLQPAGALGVFLETLNLSDDGPEFQGAKITITAKRDPLVGGDGRANLGFLNAAGVDLAGVTVSGDLVRFQAGDADPATLALGNLQAGSLGVLAAFTQPGLFDLTSTSQGGIGKFDVRGDVRGIDLDVLGGLQAGLGRVQIGGNFESGFFSGGLTSEGPIGSIVIKGSLSGVSIRTASSAKIGNISIGGNITAGFFSGIFSGSTLGAVVIGGSVLGGFPDSVFLSAERGPGAGKSGPAIKSVSIAGSASGLSIYAGLALSGIVTSTVDADAQIGPVKVKGDWRYGNISAGAERVGEGWAFGAGGDPAVVARIASITIGGTVGGSVDALTKSAFVAGQISALSIAKNRIALDPKAADLLALTNNGSVQLIELE